MDKKLITNILEQFTVETGIKTKWLPAKQAQDGGIDGEVQFQLPGQKISIPAQVKTNLLAAHLPELTGLKEEFGQIIVLAKYILPKVKDELQSLVIYYMDAAGNACIRQSLMVVVIDGRKTSTAEYEPKTKPYNKAGLKVVFLLLQQDEYINKTIRDIAKDADVSLDTVHKTINGLKELRYLVSSNTHTLAWNNKKDLLNKWLSEYDTRLKPQLHIGNFEFVNESDFLNWKKIRFKDIHTKWGGEAAGELLTGNLKPETLTIYTKEMKIDLIKNYKLIPNPNGYVKIYQNFWQHEQQTNNTVPPILAYADLINTGNKRNIETAQKVYEQYLQNRF